MREVSEKEIEQFYKEEKLNDIPDLWKNIEGNLAPKNKTTDVVEIKNKGEGERRFPVRWLAGMAAVLAVAVLAVPGWRMLGGGRKSYENSSSGMESAKNAADEWGDGMADFSASAEGPEADGEGIWDAFEEEEGISDALEGESNSQAAKGEENEFHLEAEFTVEQVQTTMEGFLVTGEILAAEEHWFESGERVTFFYEGTAYQEEDFSGTLHVLLDVEEENLKILEILP